MERTRSAPGTPEHLQPVYEKCSPAAARWVSLGISGYVLGDHDAPAPERRGLEDHPGGKCAPGACRGKREDLLHYRIHDGDAADGPHQEARGGGPEGHAPAMAAG